MNPRFSFLLCSLFLVAGVTSVAQNYESMRNTNPIFRQYDTVPSNQLDVQALTFPTNTPDNGTVGDGQFRVACAYSHFAKDDPIVHPGEPGKSHLHMFFGNTRTNALTTDETLVNTGGGSCNGFELNRSAYWTPALLDGKGNAVVPKYIIIYYKTKFPAVASEMPQGLKMVAGNTTSDDFTPSQYLQWGCGGSGSHYGKTNRIPSCGGDMMNAVISFPQCWDGVNLDSPDHQSHMAEMSPQIGCPASHPVRLPQISILYYFEPTSSVAGWHLSSDRHHGRNAPPGGTLHADWYGGWNNEIMDIWTQGCITNARNCSFGQTGTNRILNKISNLQDYTGPKYIPLPDVSLPIELSSFTVTGESEGYRIHWTTASETNNQGFGIETRRDNGPWNEVAFVSGGGTTETESSYEFFHVAPVVGLVQFRLKQQDEDGTITYSDVVETTAASPSDLHLFNVFPNPAQGYAEAQFGVATAQRVNVDLFDVTGRLVRSVFSGVMDANSSRTFRVGLDDLPGGVYNLVFKGDTASRARTVVVVR